MNRAIFVSLLVLAMFMSAACGTETSFTGTCCLNGAYYDCPDQEAEDMCAAFDPSDCTADPSKDDQCD